MAALECTCLGNRETTAQRIGLQFGKEIHVLRVSQRVVSGNDSGHY
jgi:hypothetical protein